MFFGFCCCLFCFLYLWFAIPMISSLLPHQRVSSGKNQIFRVIVFLLNLFVGSLIVLDIVQLWWAAVSI